MGFYDSVKGDIREDEDDDGSDEEDEMAFDQLKEDAENYEKGEEDDDGIEVLSSDGADVDNAPDDAPEPAPDTAPEPEQAEHPAVASDAVVASLKRIEQQNSDILDVLRGIKRSLER